MNLSLKSVKIHPDMSEETNCFSATLCLDGKPVAAVTNTGRGGSHNYIWNNHEVSKQVNAWAEQQDTEFDFEKLDQIVDGLLAKHEECQQIKRWCRTKTVFRLKGDKKDEWRIRPKKYDAEVKAALEQQFGDKLEAIGNELILAEK